MFAVSKVLGSQAAGWVLAAMAFVAAPVHAAEGAEQKPGAYVLPTDPVLDRLIQESFAARPELRAGEDLVRAQREAAIQAGALPDPSLSLGIQNDSFTSIEIGKMETSYVSAMASQTFPWPGKLGLREKISELGTDVARTDVARTRLTIEADVRRAYLDLVLVRDRKRLLDRLRELWRQSEQVAMARYEAGEGSQADVLRAQLERGRLQQRQYSLDSEERIRLQTLNRLRGRPLDESIETTVVLKDLPLADLGTADRALNDALERSPEIAALRIGTDQAKQTVALARRSYYPDLAVGAGVMFRGPMPPMWQATVSIPLPVYAGSKQSRAVAEGQARASAERERLEALVQLLGERVKEREAAWTALRDTVELYRKGLLVQSSATAESTLSQYQVGRVGFASVSEAISGYIGDEDAFLQSLADLHRIAILQAEVSLDPVALPVTGAMAPAAGMSSQGGAPAPSRTSGGAAAPTTTDSSSSTGM